MLKIADSSETGCLEDEDEEELLLEDGESDDVIFCWKSDKYSIYT